MSNDHTQSLRYAANIAIVEARFTGFDEVEPLHLLLGILLEPYGAGGNALRRHPLRPARIKELLPAGLPRTDRDRTPLAAATAGVFERAERFAAGHTDTRHVLLALLDEEEVTGVLEQLGVDVDEMSERLTRPDRAADVDHTGMRLGAGARRPEDMTKEGSVSERFTDRARRVVVLAHQEAVVLAHDYIGTEHLLLGLIRESEGVAARALAGLGIDLSSARSWVVEIIGRGRESPSGHIPFTPRAKKVLELSLREAFRLGHGYIGTEHILLGLVREGEGVAARALVAAGIELDEVRAAVIQLLAGEDVTERRHPVRLPVERPARPAARRRPPSLEAPAILAVVVLVTGFLPGRQGIASTTALVAALVAALASGTSLIAAGFDRPHRPYLRRWMRAVARGAVTVAVVAFVLHRGSWL